MPASSSPLTVAELRTIFDSGEFTGQTVAVRGVVDPRCYRFDCDLVMDVADQASPRISLAGGTPVEAELMLRKGRIVTLTGTIGDKVRSTDRVSEFIPTGLAD